MKPTLETYGYMRISLTRDGKPKNLRVHRIVAEAFIDNPDNLQYVNHKDGDKSNNKADNLEWCDASYNIKYNAEVLKKKRKNPESLEVVQFDKDMNYVAEYKTINEASKKTGIHHQSIKWVVDDEHYYKTAGGYIWKRKDDVDSSSLLN